MEAEIGMTMLQFFKSHPCHVIPAVSSDQIKVMDLGSIIPSETN